MNNSPHRDAEIDGADGDLPGAYKKNRPAFGSRMRVTFKKTNKKNLRRAAAGLGGRRLGRHSWRLGRVLKQPVPYAYPVPFHGTTIPQAAGSCKGGRGKGGKVITDASNGRIQAHSIQQEKISLPELKFCSRFPDMEC